MGQMLFLVEPDEKTKALPVFEPAVLQEESKSAEAIIDGAADGKGERLSHWFHRRVQIAHLFHPASAFIMFACSMHAMQS